MNDRKSPPSPLNLELFLDRAKNLELSTYLTKPTQHWLEGLQSNDELKLNKTREVIESFIMRLRPFLVYKENVCLLRIINNQLKNETDLDNKGLYKKVLHAFKSRRDSKAIAIIEHGNENSALFPNDLMWHFLYSGYFHSDEGKIKRTKEMNKSFVGVQEMIALSELHSFAKDVIFTAAIIRGEFKK